MGRGWYSSLLEYLALLVNGEHQRIPLPRGPLNEALASTRLFFGNEAIEYRTPTESRAGAVLGIKEYPTPTVVGMYDRLLSAPMSFVLTQSFTFLSKSTGQGLLQRQFNRMANAGDFAVSQAEELKDALDALTSNEFVMGDHIFLCRPWSTLPEIDRAPGRASAETPQRRGGTGAQLLADTGMWWRGRTWHWRPHSGRSFQELSVAAPEVAGHLAELRSHGAVSQLSTGRADGNLWGEALTLLMTGARSPYHFSLHASDPSIPTAAAAKTRAIH